MLNFDFMDIDSDGFDEIVILRTGDGRNDTEFYVESYIEIVDVIDLRT